jgi:hypothetical protein
VISVLGRRVEIVDRVALARLAHAGDDPGPVRVFG